MKNACPLRTDIRCQCGLWWLDNEKGTLDVADRIHTFKRCGFSPAAKRRLQRHLVQARTKFYEALGHCLILKKTGEPVGMDAETLREIEEVVIHFANALKAVKAE